MLGADETLDMTVTGRDFVGLEEMGVGGKKCSVSNADDLRGVWLMGSEEKRGVMGTLYLSGKSGTSSSWPCSSASPTGETTDAMAARMPVRTFMDARGGVTGGVAGEEMIVVVGGVRFPGTYAGGNAALGTEVTLAGRC